MAMTRKKRFTIFLIFTILFILTSIVLIAYSRGWRISPKELRIVQTGGIFINTFPEEAHIHLNGAEKKRPKLALSSELLIDKLTPKTYELEISADNFQSWYQQVSVQSGFVNSFQNIVLFPKHINERSLDNAKTTGALFQNKKIIYLQEQQGKKLFLKIRDMENEQAISFPIILPQNTFLYNDFRIIASSPKQRFFIFQQNKDDPQWFIFDAQSGKITLANALDSAEEKSITFHPTREDTLLFIKKGILSSMLVTTQKPTILFKKRIDGFTFINNDIYYLDSASSALMAMTDTGKNQKLVVPLQNYLANNESIFHIEPLIGGRFLLFSPDDNFIYITPTETIKALVIDRFVTDASISTDNKKIAYVKKNKNLSELWIYYLENDAQTGKEKKAQTNSFIMSLDEEIKNLTWYQNTNGAITHVMYLANKKLIIADTDDRGRINANTILSGTTTYFYSALEKILYWLADNELKQGEF